MDALGFIVLIACIAIGYLIMKKRESATNMAGGQTYQQMKSLEEELTRRKKILETIDNFLKDAQFFEPIARWRDENIYRYISNNGCLYEFEEIMAETNQRIGMDDDYLCFKQLNYKRVTNTNDFFNAHKVENLV